MSLWQPSKYIRINGIPPQVMKFPGGELQVRIPGIEDAPVLVAAHLQSSDAIMELLLVKNALYYEQVRNIEYFIPYLPYARQDRVCSGGEAFSLEVIADLFSDIGITTLDVHSEIAMSLMPNLGCIEQYNIFKTFPSNAVIVAPDKGAALKAAKVGFINSLPVITAQKLRDTESGQITGIEVQGDVYPGQTYCIVDDICDGGRTFIELAKVLKSKGAERIELYVTHGIFSQGFNVFKGLIDAVYYTNSIGDDITWHDNIKIIKKEI